MADQEVGHATLISNMLGAGAPDRCTYKYDFETVPYVRLSLVIYDYLLTRPLVVPCSEFIDFCQRLTRWGESGVLGFLSHLSARPTASLLVQSITTESRQQMAFRQLAGLFPMPVYFEVSLTPCLRTSSGTLANFLLLVASDQVGIPQSFAWTLLNPYIVSCPANNTPIAWQAFPSLSVVNGPSGIDLGFQQLPYPDGGSALTHNRTALSYPGREVELEWAAPGQATGPYNQTTFVGAQVDTNASSPVSVSLISFTRTSKN